MQLFLPHASEGWGEVIFSVCQFTPGGGGTHASWEISQSWPGGGHTPQSWPGGTPGPGYLPAGTGVVVMEAVYRFLPWHVLIMQGGSLPTPWVGVDRTWGVK